jgi:hypothetical protein
MVGRLVRFARANCLRFVANSNVRGVTRFAKLVVRVAAAEDSGERIEG